MPSETEDVYATLLLNDTYLPGALVLAHSLRDAGTTRKLAVLITTDTVTADAITELQRLFDHIIPVARLVNSKPDNLFLVQRPDLLCSFTKIALWQQRQFRKIVYMDADMVALRAPDELFDLSHAFSAAPDIGWPDLFNTGLMVLTPNMGDYYALLVMAQRGISFDGADQGLLNMHFKNTFNLLSFSYNVTPSAHYQYLPAYRHFQSSISIVHFIGSEKPWTLGREASKGSSPYDELAGRWWAVYDRHFRHTPLDNAATSLSSLVQSLVKGESPPLDSSTTDGLSFQYGNTGRETSHTAFEESKQSNGIGEASVLPFKPNRQRIEDRAISYSHWDASKAPPPTNSAPEASNFPLIRYSMSTDPTPFTPPERYPDPPQNLRYEVPKASPTGQKPSPTFPWEAYAPPATRVFPGDRHEKHNSPPLSTSILSESHSPPLEENNSPAVSPIVEYTAAEVWSNYTPRNAWDEHPGIVKYMARLQRNRKGNIQLLQDGGLVVEQISSNGKKRPSMRLTDFPTELERPSLSVTPAPIRQPVFWGETRDEARALPAAEGVPSQNEWDPTSKLAELAKHQADVLANDFVQESQAHEIPKRSLPLGSEGVMSPTYVPPETFKEQKYGVGLPDSTPRTVGQPSFQGHTTA